VPPVAPPFTLPDRYRLQAPVASGGMASVWSARDELLGREVAVKVLAEHLSSDATARSRFQREARAAASLSSHPGVVTIYDVGEHDGRSFIVMELLRGGTLGDVMARGRPDPADALRWLHDAAGALDAAHDQGIVHRDIKAANILLDDRGSAAVADFGIARIAEEEGFTSTGLVLGTAAYISPEQAMGQPATAASDRYSLAVLAFELLTGRRPFEAEHFAAQARAHVEADPPAASSINPQLRPAMDAVLARGMAKDPADRWPTATAFAQALEQAMAGDQTEPTRAMAPHAVAAAVPPPPRRTSPPRRTPPPRRGAGGPTPPGRDRSGSPLIWIAGALALLAVAAIAIAAASTGGADGNQTADKPASQTAKKSQPKATPTAKATPESTPASTPTATPTAAPAEPSGSPAQLNDQGWRRFTAGDYAGSVPFFQKAVEACGDSRELSPCGFATFNLGAALNRSGHPDQAIPYLEKRLQVWGYNQAGTVRKELNAAYKATGRKPAGRKPGRGNGNGKGEKGD
jgi:serine/threonine-protein kinase